MEATVLPRTREMLMRPDDDPMGACRDPGP
jgi:hypothetical protein